MLLNEIVEHHQMGIKQAYEPLKGLPYKDRMVRLVVLKFMLEGSDRLVNRWKVMYLRDIRIGELYRLGLAFTIAFLIGCHMSAIW